MIRVDRSFAARTCASRVRRLREHATPRQDSSGLLVSLLSSVRLPELQQAHIHTRPCLKQHINHSVAGELVQLCLFKDVAVFKRLNGG